MIIIKTHKQMEKKTKGTKKKDYIQQQPLLFDCCGDDYHYELSRLYFNPCPV